MIIEQYRCSIIFVINISEMSELRGKINKFCIEYDFQCNETMPFYIEFLKGKENCFFN